MLPKANYMEVYKKNKGDLSIPFILRPLLGNGLGQEAALQSIGTFIDMKDTIRINDPEMYIIAKLSKDLYNSTLGGNIAVGGYMAVTVHTPRPGKFLAFVDLMVDSMLSSRSFPFLESLLDDRGQPLTRLNQTKENIREFLDCMEDIDNKVFFDLRLASHITSIVNTGNLNHCLGLMGSGFDLIIKTELVGDLVQGLDLLRAERNVHLHNRFSFVS